MKVNLITNKLPVMCLLLILISTPIITVGCQEEITQPPATSTQREFSTTLVPNINIDMYVYIKQDNPTIVPKDLISTQFNAVAESLALWVIPTEDTFILGGGLTFVSVADATEIHSQIPNQAEIWTKLSDRTIYFVQGSGVVAEILKAAISKNDFKYYDDQDALREVTLLPDGGTTILAAIGIAIPSETLTQLLANNINPEYSAVVNTLLTYARLQVVTIGLYAPQQIDVAEIAQRVRNDPGLLVSPIIKIILDNAGYIETTSDGITYYEGSFDAGNTEIIPVLVRIEGNRIFVAVSGKEAYTKMLITSVLTIE